MTKLESLTPNLMVQDVNKTLDYYIDTLGFELMDTNPTTGTYEWAYVKLGEVGLMFQEETSLQKEYQELNQQKTGGGLTLYIRVTHIQALYQDLAPKVHVVKPLNKTFYNAHEFAIADPNGYILTFSELAQ